MKLSISQQLHLANLHMLQPQESNSMETNSQNSSNNSKANNNYTMEINFETPANSGHKVGETGSKKLGRKQESNEPISKRLAQNRAAQRAFRERKENYVKGLENKIKQLEEENIKSKQKNESLLGYLRKLEEENNSMKSGNFSYNGSSIQFPSSPGSLSTVNEHSSNPTMYNQDQTNFAANQIKVSETPNATNFPFDSTALNQNQGSTQTGLIDSMAGYGGQMGSYTGQSYTGLDDYMFPDLSLLPDTNLLAMNPLLTNGMNANLSNELNQDSGLQVDPNLLNMGFCGNNFSVPLPAESFPLDPRSQPMNPTLAQPVRIDEDPTEIMNPFRPPPSTDQLLKLARHHKDVEARLSRETFSIDDLCEAMRKKATCSAVQDYLTSYLGVDGLKNA